MILFWASLYLLILFVIGCATTRFNRNLGDFFLAGGRLGFVTLTLTTMASIMSGFVFVGGPGLFYQIGLGSFWITISSSFTGAMMCWLLARPLFRQAREKGCLTIPDVILSRFSCRFSSGTAGVAIMFGVVGYLGTQLKALGIILSSFLPFEATTCILIAALVIGFYSVAGGILASVYTDVVQGIVMLWTSTLVFYFALQSQGGLAPLTETLSKQDGLFLSPWGTVGAISALSWFFVFAVGSLGQPHVIHKFMMVKSLRILRAFPLILAGSMLACGLIWLGVGAVIKAMVLSGELSELSQPDDAVLVFLQSVAPVWLSSLALVGIIAAIMSTADSFANVGAASLTRDIPRSLGLSTEGPRALLWSRISVVFLIVSSTALAILSDTLVAYLGVFSFGTFAAALTPSLALGLNWPYVGKWAARLSIGVGIILSVLLESLRQLGLYVLEPSPSFIALTISFALFITVGLFKKRTGQESFL